MHRRQTAYASYVARTPSVSPPGAVHGAPSISVGIIDAVGSASQPVHVVREALSELKGKVMGHPYFDTVLNN